jgi:hypothetical protein
MAGLKVVKIFDTDVWRGQVFFYCYACGSLNSFKLKIMLNMTYGLR